MKIQTPVVVIGAAALSLLVASVVRADPPGPTCPGRAGAAPAPAGAPVAGQNLDARIGAYGGQIITVDDGSRFEIVREVRTGLVTVYAVPVAPAPGAPMAPMAVTSPPTILLSDGTEVALVATPDRPGVWTATNEAFRAETLNARLRVNASGKQLFATMPVSAVAPKSAAQDPNALPHAGMTRGSDATGPNSGAAGSQPGVTPFPSSGDAAPAPAVPAVSVEPVPTAPDNGPKGGNLLTFNGTDAKVEMARDIEAGEVTLRNATNAGSPANVESATLIVMQAGATPRRLNFDKGASGAWSVKDPILRLENISATLEAKIDGKVMSVTVPPSLAKGAVATSAIGAPATTHGGRIVSFGDDFAPVEVVQDLSAGQLTVYAIETPGHAVRWTGSPTVSIASTTGPSRTLNLTPVAGVQGAWSVTDTSLRSRDLDGKIIVNADGRSHEASLRATEPAKDSPRDRDNDSDRKNKDSDSDKPKDTDSGNMPK